jgi:hypothetical protein
VPSTFRNEDKSKLNQTNELCVRAQVRLRGFLPFVAGKKRKRKKKKT